MAKAPKMSAAEEEHRQYNLQRQVLREFQTQYTQLADAHAALLNLYATVLEERSHLEVQMAKLVKTYAEQVDKRAHRSAANGDHRSPLGTFAWNPETGWERVANPEDADE